MRSAVEDCCWGLPLKMKQRQRCMSGIFISLLSSFHQPWFAVETMPASLTVSSGGHSSLIGCCDDTVITGLLLWSNDATTQPSFYSIMIIPSSISLLWCYSSLIDSCYDVIITASLLRWSLILDLLLWWSYHLWQSVVMLPNPWLTVVMMPSLPVCCGNPATLIGYCEESIITDNQMLCSPSLIGSCDNLIVIDSLLGSSLVFDWLLWWSLHQYQSVVVLPSFFCINCRLYFIKSDQLLCLSYHPWFTLKWLH